MTITRTRPDVTVKVDSPNQSDRFTGPSLIVLHSTESSNIPNSPSDLEGVASWLCNPVAGASAHVIVDSDGKSARVVPDHRKAWACVSYNSASLNIEQIGHAEQTHWAYSEWIEAARWIAQWSHEFHIPIRRATVNGGRVLRTGVTTHKKLGSLGGGHVDPGFHYPLGKVLRQARHIKKLRYA